MTIPYSLCYFFLILEPIKNSKDYNWFSRVAIVFFLQIKYYAEYAIRYIISAIFHPIQYIIYHIWLIFVHREKRKTGRKFAAGIENKKADSTN